MSDRCIVSFGMCKSLIKIQIYLNAQQLTAIAHYCFH